MSADEKLRLTHIAEATALIADYLKGVSKEAFLNDRLRQDAVIRRIQVLDRRGGKAAKEVLCAAGVAVRLDPAAAHTSQDKTAVNARFW
jgi:uncharacterized protein with HEPN domain